MAWPLGIILPIAGFLLGSIPVGYIVAKAKGIDIRATGSGNIGATNVWRALGWQWGVTVLAADILKGLLPTLAAVLLTRGQTQASGWAPSGAAWLAMATGLCAVLGHTFTPWLRFKGGKGVATGLGALLALFQAWALIPLAIFLRGHGSLAHGLAGQYPGGDQRRGRELLRARAAAILALRAAHGRACGLYAPEQHLPHPQGSGEPHRAQGAPRTSGRSSRGCWPSPRSC